MVNFLGRETGLVRFAASLITFAYIFLWHGLMARNSHLKLSGCHQSLTLQENVFVWSLLNFVGVTLEAVARGVGSHPYYLNIEV